MTTWLNEVEHMQYLSLGEMLRAETMPSIPGLIVLNTSPVFRSKMIILLDADTTYLMSLVIDIPTANKQKQKVSRKDRDNILQLKS